MDQNSVVKSARQAFFSECADRRQRGVNAMNVLMGRVVDFAAKLS